MISIESHPTPRRLFGSQRNRGKAIAPSAPNTIYDATADGHIFVSLNDGNSWAQRDIVVASHVIGGVYNQFMVDPVNAGTVYAVRASFNNGTSVGHVFKTTDGGTIWQDVSGNLPDLPTWSLVIDSRPTTARMYVGNDNGVYSSTDGGTTWTPYKSGLPNVQVTSLTLDPTTNILAAGTHGRGLYEIQIAQTISVTMIPPTSIAEGATLSGIPVAQFTDLVAADPLSSYSATINWGDGHTTTMATIGAATGGGFTISGSNTYAEEGTYTISITVQDADGDSGQNSVTVKVADAPLTTPANFVINSTEGLNFNGVVTTFQDGNPGAPASGLTASITWGNGNTTTGQVVADPQGNGLFDVMGKDFYNDEGSYPVSVRITDVGGAAITASGQAVIADAPVTSTPQAFSSLEGSAFNGQVALFTDSNPQGVLSDYSATIDWGDGSPTTTSTITASGGQFRVSGSHTFNAAGTNPVVVTINDVGKASTTAKSTAHVSDAGLMATPTTVTSAKAQALASTTGVASFVDGNAAAKPGDFSATTIDWGDKTPATAGTIVATGAGTFRVQGGHTYTNPGTYPITVPIDDVGGRKATAHSTPIVADVPVSATGTTVKGPQGQTVVEGNPLSNALVATFTDPDNGPVGYYTAKIDWGDQSGTSGGTVAFDPQVTDQYDVSGSHTYRQAGKFTVTDTVADAGVSSTTVTSTVNVVDAPLTITPASLNGLGVGTPFTGNVASFTDGNPLAIPGDFSTSINWGDGNASPGQVVAAPGGGFNVVGSNTSAHASAAGQPYPIALTIVDRSSTQPYSATTSAQVVDAPIIATGQSISAVEGLAFSGVVAGFTDPDLLAQPSEFAATINWGDGHSTPGTIQALGGGSDNVSGTNTYAHSGSYPISVAISHSGGASSTALGMAVVSVAPVMPAASIAPVNIFQGTAFTGPVVQFSVANPDATAGSFNATINWGDGHVTTGDILQDGGGVFTVSGTNTYSSQGQFPITVTINRIGGNSVPEAATAQVLAPLQGTTGDGGATNNTQPTFSGTAQAGTVVHLLVQASRSSSPQEIGQAIVDSSGHWSLQSNQALPDGSCTVTAALAGASGTPLASLGLGTVQVDTQGPTVDSVVFTPATRQLRVTFRNTGSGLNPTALANATNYVLGLASKRGLRRFPVTSLQTMAGALGSGQVTEIVTYNRGRRPAAGTYVVTLNARGITDRAGSMLGATTFVKDLQTTNAPDPDYIAQFKVNRNLAASAPQVDTTAGERAAAARFSRRIRGR